MSPHLADALDIVQWAQRVGARTDFPVLVRRLIRQTNDQVVGLEMRSAEGAGFAGYDGRVEASKATPLVPLGRSVWELGVGEGPEAKADEDYEKRTEDSLDVDKSQTTFVFATARRWAGKDAWAATRRSEGHWQDVQAFDADNLSIAFESAPAAHYWFSELIDKPVDGVHTVEHWWESFSRVSQPNLTPELLLSGRPNEAAELLQLLKQETRITTISAPSTDDVLAFVAATLLSTPEPLGSDLLERALIVYDDVSLRRLDGTTKLLVLLPFEDDLRRQAQLVRSHHVIFLAPEDVPADIKLPPIDRDEFAAALEQTGVHEDAAKAFAVAAHRSIVAYQREAPSRGVVPRDWSSWFASRIVRRASMAGAWHEARSGDTDALAALFGTPYEDARAELEPLAAGEDPLFATVGASWTVISVEQSWQYGRAHLTGLDLSALETAMQTVLGAVDPALELPVNQRWMAEVYGKTRVHSSDLRNGLATTLALCGALGGGTQIGSSGTAADWASSVVAQILRRANDNVSGQLWASLSDVLPLLAESAPDVFLREVQEGVTERSQPVLATMFLDQEGDVFSVSSPHTGLLWALETVAWSSEHAALTVLLLARLAEIDPGGRLSNRPMNSLADIFRPWLPQTSLSGQRRLTVLDALRRDHAAVAWTLMLRLLPEHSAVGGYTHSPRFRTWKPESEGVTIAEFLEFSSAVAQRLLEDAERSDGRWIELVDRLDDFPPPERAAAIDQLRTLGSSDRLSADLRKQLWNRLDTMARRHRSFASAEWALPGEDVDQLAELAALYEPTDLVAVHAWLFAGHFPDIGTEGLDFHETEERVRAARISAVDEVLAVEGFDGLLRLAASVEYPWFVGMAAVPRASKDFDELVVSLLDHEDAKLTTFAAGYSHNRARNEGLPWVNLKLERVAGRPVAQARLLQTSDALPEVWEIASGLGHEVEEAYWREFSPIGRGADFEFVNEAAQSLMRFGRPIAALNLMNLYVRKEDQRVSPDLVADGLQTMARLPADHEESLHLAGYELDALLNYLRDVEFDEERLGLLEWQFLPALGFDARSPVLERRLARTPEFFAEIVSLIYKPRGSDEGSDVPQHVASNAHRLLDEWKIVPGSDDRMEIVNEHALVEWVTKARDLLSAADRREIGDVHIGKIFAHARGDEDETWPTLPVRNVIERLASADIEDGFRTQVYNNRGPTTRGMLDGGDQERQLAGRFHEHAARIRDGWPRTAAILTSLAAGYEREAGRHDEEVERLRQGLER